MVESNEPRSMVEEPHSSRPSRSDRLVAVNITVHGHAVEFFPDKKGRFGLELAEPLTIRDILGRLGVKPELVAIVLVNGHRQGTNYVPIDGDEIAFLSPVAGG